ncbi:MAG TPA: condensation domain-containing protein [Rhizomicrobium sp.]|nr:condensation domain-containing protein [Rhizomicrobium sp.]
MTVAKLITGLESRNIILSLDGDQIRYRSPKHALSDSDRDVLRGRRGEIVEFLKARNAARALRTAAPHKGPLTPSVAQEMWRAFAGGPQEGKPIALNIGMVGHFNSTPQAVTAAIRQVIARYDALRTRFEARDGGLQAFHNPAESFEVEQEDLRGLGADAGRAAAEKGAQEFCARLNLIEGTWLTRAKVFALQDDESLAAISSAHMIADAGTRNILLEEIHDILETGAPCAPSPVFYNDYALAEREVLASGHGAQLIEHWRRWYHDQPTMLAPLDRTPLIWGNGIRIVKNFTIPPRVADKVRRLAASLKVTSFLVYLTVFCVAMARWARMERFPVRVLGDKRVSLELTNTVGLMFCADAVEINVPSESDFETVMRGILAEYDAALALRIPGLHFWAPYCVRPGIEAPDYPNKIPAVFNYYSLGTAREKAERRQALDAGASLPWPPDIETLTQTWPRRSSPLFLHVMDYGHEVQVSLHFFQGAVSPPDQDNFTAMLFRLFADMVPV